MITHILALLALAKLRLRILVYAVTHGGARDVATLHRRGALDATWPWVGAVEPAAAISLEHLRQIRTLYATLVIPIDLDPLPTVGGDLIKPRKFGVKKQVFGAGPGCRS